MKYITLLALVILTGCASSTTTYLPDGRQGYSLNCSGTARTWGMCYEKAGEICGATGYDVVLQNGETGETVSGSATGSSANIFGSSLHFRTMTVACKDSSAYNPQE